MNESSGAVACYSRIARGLLVFAIYSVAATAMEMPVPLGQLIVHAPATSVRVTPDGKRLAIQLQPSQGNAAEIQIVDTSNPRQPSVVGHVAIDKNGELAISTDGSYLLFSVEVDKHEWGKAGRYQITAIDINNPSRPKQLWQRIVVAREIALAPDASAYAFSQPSDGKIDQWEVVATWVNRQRDKLTLPLQQYEDTSGMRMSLQGRFLAYGSYGQLKVDDLRHKVPASFEQGYRGMGQSTCLIALLDTGHLLVEDLRAPRFGVYAPKAGVPRIGRLDLGNVSTMNSCQFDLSATQGSNVLLSDAARRIYQLDIGQPEHPRLIGVWALPKDVGISGVDTSDHIYSLQTTDGQSTIGIYDLSKATAPFVDWKALESAWTVALQIYSDKGRSEFTRQWDAIRKFEEVTPLLALDANIEGISQKTAAGILNDYAYLLWKGQSWRKSDIEVLLRRSIVLDPNRASAHLNLADLLRSLLSTTTNWQKKRALKMEAVQHYRKYLALGGRQTIEIDSFVKDNLDSPPAKDICEATVRYANAGRLNELVSGTGIDIPTGGKKFDLVFTTEGMAHVPTFYTFNSADDTPADSGIFSSPNNEDLWGGDELGLVVYENSTHILHYRDFRHPVASSSLSGEERCEFKTTTVEKMGAKALEPELCAQLNTNQGPQAIKFDGATWMTREDVSASYGETGIVGAKKIDIGNDGNPVNVALFGLSSGAGAGCEEVFFDQVDSYGAHFESGPKRSLLMELQRADPSNRYPILPCGNQPKFFDYQGRIYFESRPATWPPIDTWDQYHRVARINGGVVEDVCDFSFATTVAITREDQPKEEPVTETTSSAQPEQTLPTRYRPTSSEVFLIKPKLLRAAFDWQRLYWPRQ